jgi:hypothetical protein
MTAITAVVIKVVASARSVTVVDLLIVLLHAADSASVQVVDSVNALRAVIAQALANAQVAVSQIVAHHAAVRLATVLTAHRATTALLIAKRSKMHATTHVASKHLHRIAL